MLQLFAANVKLSQEQIKNIKIIREVARSIPDKWGMTYEDTLSAICLTESSCSNGKNGYGVVGDANKVKRPEIEKSVGLLQIQHRTAKFMAKIHKDLGYINDMPEAKLFVKLLKDIRFSAKVAAHYLIWLSHTRKHHLWKLHYIHIISGYNGGYVNKPYYKRVMKNMAKIKILKQKGILN